MIEVKRPATPAYFKSAVIRNAWEMLERHFSRCSQERIKIDNGLLRPINELLFFVFKEKCAYCETPIEHPE